jgi:hypothetical protein
MVLHLQGKLSAEAQLSQASSQDAIPVVHLVLAVVVQH